MFGGVLCLRMLTPSWNMKKTVSFSCLMHMFEFTLFGSSDQKQFSEIFFGFFDIEIDGRQKCMRKNSVLVKLLCSYSSTKIPFQVLYKKNYLETLDGYFRYFQRTRYTFKIPRWNNVCFLRFLEDNWIVP